MNTNAPFCLKNQCMILEQSIYAAMWCVYLKL